MRSSSRVGTGAVGVLAVAVSFGCSSPPSDVDQTAFPPDAQVGQSGQMGSGGTGPSNGGTTTSTGGTSGSMGNGGAAGSGGSSTGDDAAACATYLDAYCAWNARCDPVVLRQNWDTVARCKDENTRACLDSLSAPGAGRTAAGLVTCAQKVAAAECSVAFYTVCSIQGSLADGAACRYDSQCAAGVCQRAEWYSDCGHCAPPGGEGAACHQFNGCADGLECSLGGSTRDTCVRVSPVGGACTFDQNNCAYPYACKNGSCEVRPRLGEPCTPEPYVCDQTQDGECINDYCTPFQWVHEGEACDSSRAIVCVGGLTCNRTIGKCEKSPPAVSSLAADCK